jgi:hypothetical protein
LAKEKLFFSSDTCLFDSGQNRFKRFYQYQFPDTPPSSNQVHGIQHPEQSPVKEDGLEAGSFCSGDGLKNLRSGWPFVALQQGDHG